MARLVAKAALICGLILAVSLPATAQNITFPDNNQYWKNAEPVDGGGEVKEFTARCGESGDVQQISLTGGSVSGDVSSGSSSVTVHNNDIQGLGDSGETDINVSCSDSDDPGLEKLRIATLKASIQDEVGRYENVDYGVGERVLDSDPDFEAPVLKLNASIGGDNSIPTNNEATVNEDFETERATEFEESNGYRSVRFYPDKDQSDNPSYRFNVVFKPSGTTDEKIVVDEEDSTSDGEPPEIEIFDDYRVTEISSSLPESSFQPYGELNGLEYGFRFTFLGESVTPSDSDSVAPNRKGFLFTTVETVEEVGEEGNEYAEYRQKNWFSRPEYQGDGRWNTSLETSPVLEAGLYRFKTDLAIPERDIDQRLGEVFVERNMDFNGKVVDSSSSRNPIDATFKFFDGGTKENDFSTSPDGTYTSRVDRKTYDSVEMDFYDERSRSSATESFDARVTASDVEIGDNQGSVRFDYFRNPSVSIPGISPVNMMATQFGYDVGGVTEIEMAYNSGRVSVEKAQVFECRNWNYFARSCQTDWERLDEDDYDVNPVSEQVSITGAEPYVLPEDLSGSRNSQRILKNAYVVGTAADLGLQGDIEVGAEGGRAPVGSDISVSGSVVAGGGAPVANAGVTANLSIGGEEYGSQTTQTDAEGRFSASLEAPESPGNYTVSVAAEKQPYSSFSESFDQSLTAYVEKGVQVSLKGVTGGQLSLVKGREIEKEIEVLNTGQRPVKDVEVSVSNLDEDFYNLSSARINEIAEGDTESVGLDILIPENFALNQFPSFTVSAQGSSDNKQVSSEAQIFTVVNQVSDVEDRNDSSQTEIGDNSSSTSATQGSSNLLGSFSSAPSLSPELPSTGDFAGQTSDVNLILGLVFVFLLVVAAAVKKRDSGSGEGRGRISHDRPAVTSVSGGATNLAGGAGATGSTTAEQDGASSDGAVSQPSEDENVCGECGEEFDTDAALEMHREAAH